MSFYRRLFSIVYLQRIQEYDYASYFNEGYAIAQKGSQWYILRATGNQAHPAPST